MFHMESSFVIQYLSCNNFSYQNNSGITCSNTGETVGQRSFFLYAVGVRETS